MPVVVVFSLFSSRRNETKVTKKKRSREKTGISAKGNACGTTTQRDVEENGILKGKRRNKIK